MVKNLLDRLLGRGGRGFPFLLVFSFIVFLVFPSLELIFNPRPINLVLSTAWITIIFFGIYFFLFFYFSINEFLASKIDSVIKIIFLASLSVCLALSLLFMSAVNFNLLYWDSYHVVRMTSETILGDWRSFFFEALSFYVLQFYDHVYSVNFIAVLFYLLVLNIPILWCKERRKAWLVCGVIILITVTPHYLPNSLMFFTDTFFSSFSVLSIYLLFILVGRLNSVRKRTKSAQAGEVLPVLVIFILVAVAAVNFRHNGIVLAVFLCGGILYFIDARRCGIAITMLFVSCLFGISYLKNSAYFPDANHDSIHTNRNFQKVALVLNLWGAMLTSKDGYVTPSKESDLMVLSYFIDPEIVKETYSAKNPVLLWNIFANPWRIIDSEKTDKFIKLSGERVMQNIPIFVSDRSLFIASMLFRKDSPGGIEKDCALGVRQSCPSFGSKFQNIRYNAQIRNFATSHGHFVEKVINWHLNFKYSGILVLLSLFWLVFLIVSRGRNEFTVFIGLYGIFAFLSLIITLPSPEFRYLFPITFLFVASILLKLSGKIDSAISN